MFAVADEWADANAMAEVEVSKSLNERKRKLEEEMREKIETKRGKWAEVAVIEMEEDLVDKIESLNSVKNRYALRTCG